MDVEADADMRQEAGSAAGPAAAAGLSWRGDEPAAGRAPARPVLRYHGGKWRLAPWVIRHFPAHRVYVEPYAGAASVLLRKPRSYAEVYNDRAGNIVHVFRVLRDPVAAAELERRLRLTPFARTEFVASYGPAADDVDRARLAIVRSFMGFGSIGVTRDARTGFRANSNRSGTTPAHDWMHWPEQVAAFTARLQGVVIDERDALDVIRQHDSPATLFYVDPPYVHATRGPDQRYEHEMDDAGQHALAAVLHAVRGMVVLSGYPCALYDTELYPTWARVEVGAFADGARRRTECLWLNPAAVVGRHEHPTLGFGATP